jgi:hypothetical protein
MAERRLVLKYSKAEDNWRWEPGSEAKGTALVLGDPKTTTEPVLIGESESDDLRAWSLTPEGGAVLGLPGALMVPDDLADFIAPRVPIVLAMDADEAGDKGAAKCWEVLRSAGVLPEHIRRLRPAVEGHEKPDLRDLIEGLEAADPDTAGEVFWELVCEAPVMDEPELEQGGSVGCVSSVTEDIVVWEQPVPLDRPRLPSFPIDALPLCVRRWVESTTIALQVPVDLPAAMALGTLGAAVGGSVQVELRPPDWVEPINLWIAVVLPSGERKSPTVEAAVRPLEAVERDRVEASRLSVLTAQDLYEVAEKRLQKAIGKAGAAEKAADRHVEEERVRSLRAELEEMDRPELPRLLADNSTPEALVSLIATHTRMGVVSSEGGLFDLLAGRYSKGQPKLEDVLKAYSGETVRVDRVNRPPEYVERPILSLAFAVQPVVLERVLELPAMREQGFLARFSFFMPVTALGHRQVDPPPPAVPESVTTEWDQLVRSLAWYTGDRTDATDTTSLSLRLSEDARSRFQAFRAKLEPRLDPERGDLFVASDWVGKHEGRVGRIAGLCHLVEQGDRAMEVPISYDTMDRAIAIGDYLVEHALAALDVHGPGGEDRGRAREVLRWVRRTKASYFTTRDATRGLHSQRFPDVDTVARVLRLLEDLGYLRRRAEPPSGSRGGRPPSPTWDVNPVVLEASPPPQGVAATPLLPLGATEAVSSSPQPPVGGGDNGDDGRQRSGVATRDAAGAVVALAEFPAAREREQS